MWIDHADQRYVLSSTESLLRFRGLVVDHARLLVWHRAAGHFNGSGLEGGCDTALSFAGFDKADLSPQDRGVSRVLSPTGIGPRIDGPFTLGLILVAATVVSKIQIPGTFFGSALALMRLLSPRCGLPSTWSLGSEMRLVTIPMRLIG